MSPLDSLGDYDRWKLASPDDGHGDPEPDFYCETCRDEGWSEGDDSLVPCPHCSATITLDDLDYLDEIESGR